MKDRLAKFIKNEGLTPSRFAEIMGIPPSNVSHLLSGRNKPGFDFIAKIIMRFPKLNPDWLILGASPMYRPAFDTASGENRQAAENNATPPPVATVYSDALLFPELQPTSEPAKTPTPDVLPVDSQKSTTVEPAAAMQQNSIIREKTPESDPATRSSQTFPEEIPQEVPYLITQTPVKEIDRIIIFYKDHTFSSYFPDKGD